MAKPPFWHDEPDVWDSLFVASDTGPIRAPGIVEEIKVTVKNKIDKHHGPGINGGTITVQGEDVVEVKTSLKFWSKEHQAELERFLAVIRPLDKKTAIKPRDFTHPVLTEFGVKSLIFESLEGPSVPDSSGFRKLDLTLVSFKLPKAVGSTTPKSSVAVQSVYSTTPYQRDWPFVKWSQINKPKTPAQRGSKP